MRSREGGRNGRRKCRGDVADGAGSSECMSLMGKVVVKAATIERAAVMMEEASGLDIENGLRHFQVCLSSTGVMYLSGSFFSDLPGNYGPDERAMGSF